METITTLVQPLIDIQLTLEQMPSDFDIDEAVDVQLDAVGLWAGISRIINGSSGLFSLSNDTYRLLIKTKIAANHWDGTISGMIAVLSPLFSDYEFFVIDNFDMSMDVGILGLDPDSELASVFAGGYIPLKPDGVRVNYTFNTIFGFDYQNQYIAGFDTGYII